jgi:nucleoside recognition membrane protein YjiH
MNSAKRHYTSAQIMKFVIPSLVGAVAFVMPIPQGNTLNTLLGMLIDFGKNILKDYLPVTAMVFVVLSAAVSLVAVVAKPKFIMENEFMRDLFFISPFWLVSRVLGGVLYVVILYHIGPEVVWNMDNGGTPGIVLAPALLIIFLILAGFVPLLTDYGLMEYVGTFARPVMGPLFKLPGRAAIDCIASWVGSSSVAVVITTKIHDQGYYSDREASIISTTFSVISIAYVYVMADFVKLQHMYFQILLSVYTVTFILALIMPRVWPLSSIPDTYSGRAGKQRVGDDVPSDKTLGQWALELAVNRAANQTLGTTLNSVVKNLVSLIASTMPLVISWGTITLIIANNTPVFKLIATPFTWLLNFMSIPEAAEVGTAFILSYADQFLAAVVGAGAATDAARFMCAGISATGLIYMTEVGVLILNSSIPLSFFKLTVIYVIRALLTVFLLSPFAWYFTM